VTRCPIVHLTTVSHPGRRVAECGECGGWFPDDGSDGWEAMVRDHVLSHGFDVQLPGFEDDLSI